MDIIKMITKKKCYVGQNKPAYVVIHETDNWGKDADANAHARAMSNETWMPMCITMWILKVFTRPWSIQTEPGR